MPEVSDHYLMTWGKFKGTKIANVPASYLLYIVEYLNPPQEVFQYVEENYDLLKSECDDKES